MVVREMNGEPRPYFRVLGPLSAWRGGRPLDLGAPQQRAVLAALLVRAGHVMPRAELVDAVWGEAAAPSAVNMVQSYVARLRKVLEPGRAARTSPRVLVTSGDGYLVQVGEDQVDLGVFERRRAAARAARAAGDAGTAAVELAQALALWQGPALAGVPGPFAQIQRDRLGELRLATVEMRLDLDLELGRHAEVVAELAALVAEHPLREQLHAQLMLALYRSGRQGDALAAYDRYRRMLAAELGIDPGAPLQRLHQAILTNAPEIAAPGRPAGLAALPQPMPRPAQLPPDVPGFTGRSGQIGQLRRLLAGDAGGDGQAVAVGLIAGKAGVGKTALAVYVAHQLRPCFSDGQLFVNLRGAGPESADPAAVLARFLRALGVDGSAMPGAVDERVELYRSQVADKKLLIVLDDAVSEAQVRPLVPGTPSCRVLVTSRRRLGGIAAALTIDLDVLTAEEAVGLLAPAAEAGRLSAEPQAAREIVRLCGYLPLAVRIAGARLAANPHWPLAHLAGRLADEKRRLDELVAGDLNVRASVELSYRALTAEQRRAFRMLGLLDGPGVPGWVIAALLDLPLGRAEEAADALAAAQLLEIAGPGAEHGSRYRFHDLVRLVARERAVGEEPEAARRAALERAVAAWLWQAERAATALPSHKFGTIRGVTRRYPVDGLATMPARWFDAEHEALAAAVRQAADHGYAGQAWELAAALTDYFALHASYDDWRQTHTWALDACRRAGDRLGEAVMLRGLAELAWFGNEADTIMRHAGDALRIFRDLGEPTGEVDTLLQQAVAHGMQGRHGTQLELARTALALAKSAGYRLGQVEALQQLALLCQIHGDLNQAADYCAQSGEGAAEIGDRYLHGQALLGLATIRRDQDRFDDALDYVTSALAEFRQIGYKASEAWAMMHLAGILARQGDPGARTAAEQAMALHTDLHLPAGQARVQRYLGVIYLNDGLPGEAIRRLGCAVRSERATGGHFSLALTLRELGRAYHAAGDLDAARAAWTEARDLFTGLGNPRAAEITVLLDSVQPVPGSALTT